MKMDWPPTKTENNLEEIKKDFSGWVDNYLNDFYENGNFLAIDPFNNPVETKINSIADENGYITEGMKNLTLIFGQKLVEFSNNLIFNKNYDETIANNFFNNLHKTFFARSPTVFENLNIDFLQKTIMSSEISETYGLRDVVDISGETAYDLSFCSKETVENIIKDMGEISGAKKISAIKQLSSSAMSACGNGDWAEPAYNNILHLINEVKKTENSPIVSFVLDFELKKILNYSHNLNNFESVDNLEDYKEETIFKDLNIFKKTSQESSIFFDHNKIVPCLKNVFYSKVSKDYGSVVLPGNITPIALVKNSEDGNFIEKKTNFSLQELENMKSFLEEINNTKSKDEQFYINIGSIPRYLKSKNLEDVDFTTITNSETLGALDKNFKELEVLSKKLRSDSSLSETYDNIITETVILSKEININELKKIVETIINKNNIEYTPLPIKSYDGITKNKELNFFGDEDFSHIVKIFHSPEIRNYINNRLNINIEELYLAEQIYFLKYLSASNENTFSRLENVLNNKEKKDSINFLRSFLSMSGDVTMGDKILELGEKLPEGVAQKVFTKYGEIIDSVSKITEFARTNFTKEIETNPELIKKIEETLYIKGKQLLSQTYDDLDGRKEINYADIENQLDRINADTITTFAIFKQALKNGEKLPIESIEGAVFSKKDAGEISKDQENEMIEMYEINWKNHPDRNFVESLKSYFKTAFSPEKNKEKNYLYTFEKDKKIRAFVRFEKQDDESFYASALNVDEASKNFGLGEAMMDEALTREAEEHILHASCRKDNPSNMRYFEKGFISKGFKKTSETEEFDLVWDQNKNKEIKAKQKSQEELIDLYDNSNTDDFEIKKSKDLESLHSTIPENKSLVRCFVKNGEWYAVYEKVREDYGVNFEDTK